MLRADFDLGDRHLVVMGRYEIIQQHAIGDFPRECQRLCAGRADIKRDAARLSPSGHDVEMHVIEMDELATIRHALELHETFEGCQHFAHGEQVLAPRHADLRRERVVPRA